MRKLEEIKKILSKHKDELSEKYKVKMLGVFGSYVREEQTEISDVDILVEFAEPVGFEFIHLADYLEELLGLPVDLVTRDAIKPNRWKLVSEKLMYV
ncbi:MAG: nucleotidyltransferase family protein [Deltaproteobacteria bacterium]|nr:nucleotidyltransferase family protein [Deltaproteobacteria bacterium]